MPRDPVHQRLEQEQSEQQRFDRVHAVGRRVVTHQLAVEFGHARKPVEGETDHPPVASQVELQLPRYAVFRDHRGKPGRHLPAPVPDDGEQAHGDHDGEEKSGDLDRLGTGAGQLQGALLKVTRERQDDHEVEGGHQAMRGDVVDRRDTPGRRLGPQPDAEHEIEGPPVNQHHQELLAELAMESLPVTQLAEDKPAGDPQRRQGSGIEHRGARKSRNRGSADEAASLQPTEQQPHQIFGRQARDDDARQQQRRLYARDDFRQSQQMRDQRGKVRDRHFQPGDDGIDERAAPIGFCLDCLCDSRKYPQSGQTARDNPPDPRRSHCQFSPVHNSSLGQFRQPCQMSTRLRRPNLTLAWRRETARWRESPTSSVVHEGHPSARSGRGSRGRLDRALWHSACGSPA